MNNKLLVQTAIACVACDGTFDERELVLLRDYIAREGLCTPEELESDIGVFKKRLSEEGLTSLREIVDRLGEAAFKAEEAVPILETAREIILADEKVEYLEVKFFKLLCKVLHIQQPSLPKLIPDIEPLFYEEDIETVSPIDDYFRTAELLAQEDSGKEE